MAALKQVESGEVPAEEVGRRNVYVFLAGALTAPAQSTEADLAARFSDPTTPLGQAFRDFHRAFQASDRTAREREFHDLFVGVGRGELLPYASYYLTGFLHEKPLAKLRASLAEMGFGRSEAVREPEDHLGFLCDVMAQLIEGTWAGEFKVYEQDRFFAEHISPWADRFFADLEAAETADLYRSVGKIGRLFMEIEEQGFAMVARA